MYWKTNLHGHLSQGCEIITGDVVTVEVNDWSLTKDNGDDHRM